MKLKLLAAICIVLGLAIRLYLAFVLPPWFDESFTQNYLRHPFSILLSGSLETTHPPGYYLFLSAWSSISGSLLWLRVSTILFSIFSGVFLFGFGKRIVNIRYAYVLLISYALSGYSVVFDWQIRPYTLLFMFVAWSLYLVSGTPKKTTLFAFAVVNFIGLLIDYGFIWYMGLLGLFLLIRSSPRAGRNRWLPFLWSASGSTGLFLLFWFPHMQRYFLQGMGEVAWLTPYTSPSFFIPFFLGAAHGFWPYVGVLSVFVIAGGVLTLPLNNPLPRFLTVAASGVLAAAYIVSVFVSPVLHVRNLQIVGLTVLLLYAVYFFRISRYKVFALLSIGLYLCNFLLIVHTIFSSPGKLLISF